MRPPQHALITSACSSRDARPSRWLSGCGTCGTSTRAMTLATSPWLRRCRSYSIPATQSSTAGDITQSSTSTGGRTEARGLSAPRPLRKSGLMGTGQRGDRPEPGLLRDDRPGHDVAGPSARQVLDGHHRSESGKVATIHRDDRLVGERARHDVRVVDLLAECRAVAEQLQ